MKHLKLIIFLTLFAAALLHVYGEETINTIKPLIFPAPAAAQPVVTAEEPVETHSDIASITWFGRECGSQWCLDHKDKPREKVVAVNVAKYGYLKSVYIPVWDAHYEVIEKPYTNTDGKTDIDVWCNSDEKCQQQVGGGKQLRVYFYY